MFDIGFSELVVIGLVALIVIGPERLPRVARTVGALLGRFQRYVNDVKTEVRREMEIEDLKRFQAQLSSQVREVEQTIHKELNSVEGEARSLMAEVEAGAPGPQAAADAASPADGAPVTLPAGEGEPPAEAQSAAKSGSIP